MSFKTRIGLWVIQNMPIKFFGQNDFYKRTSEQFYSCYFQNELVKSRLLIPGIKIYTLIYSVYLYIDFFLQYFFHA